MIASNRMSLSRARGLRIGDNSRYSGKVSRPGSVTLNTVHDKWQNLTLFLAALAGSCVQAKNLDVVGSVIANKYLPDRMHVIQDPLSLIEDSTSDDEDSDYEGTKT